MEDECRGCILKHGMDSLSEDCPIGLPKHLSETEQCPCINCLVKVVCMGVCQPFKDYVLLVKEITGKKI